MSKKTTKATTSTGASFSKIMLASAVGFVIATVALTILSIVFFAGMAASSSKNEEVLEKTVLTIKLNYPIVEQGKDDFNFDLNITGFNNVNSVGLNDILSAIKTAKTDENISGIFLDLGVIQASMSDLYEIRKALEDFKESGKFIIAHSDMYLPGSYYLATVADKVYLTPTGNMFWQGYSTSVMYYKGLLEKLDIQPEIIRHGKFKSAVEPYMLDSMSNENRLQLETLLNSLWDRYVDEIAQARSLDTKALNTYADSLMINSSEKAVALNFIDKEMFKNDVIAEMKEMVGLKPKKHFRSITLKKYISMHKKEDFGFPAGKSKKDKIAIIYAEGQIITGKSKENAMGSETIANAIRKAASDSTVKAIVFRVNSPGGSALASEIILHEIELAKQHKPVIVSMGRYAASGGYYISCLADKIYAEPYTITGSIGVFGMMFNLEKLMNNKLGVNVEVVKTNENADFGNMFKPLSNTERAYLQYQIEDIYDKFITHVADGRSLTKEYVDSIGQGRVWSADDAVKIGLVDEIGTLQDAVNEAVKVAGLENYEVIEYPKVKNFIERLLEQYETQLTMKKTGELYDLYQKIENLQYLNGIQMLMPYEIDIK